MRLPSEISVLRVVARHGPIKSTIGLHNLVHELQERRVLDTDFTFIRYSFGYYSGELEEALRRLEGLGLIKVTKSNEGLEVYEVTERGLEILRTVSEPRNRW